MLRKKKYVKKEEICEEICESCVKCEKYVKLFVKIFVKLFVKAVRNMKTNLNSGGKLMRPLGAIFNLRPCGSPVKVNIYPGVI